MADRITYKVHDIVIPQANDPTKTISKTVYEAETHHSEGGMIGFAAPDATLVSNVLTPADSLVVVRGEGASADTIDFISFTSDPQIKDKDLVWLQQGAEAITINHNTGSPPANAGPVLLLSQVPKTMIGSRMVCLQKQGSNFQEITYDGIVGNGGILAEDDEGNAIIVCGSVPSAVNHLKTTNAATGNDVVIESIGTDPNIGLEIKGKGTKFVKILSLIVTTLLDANSLAWAKVVSIASAVNEITFSNAATGTDPIIEGTGSDTDVGIELKTKGTGVITAINTKITNIRESTGSALALIITGAASIVNHFEIKPSIAASDLELNALGADTNIGIKITPKGTGRVTILEQIVTNIREATGGAIAIAITALASAVNYIEVKANIASSDPEIEAKGSDTNVGIKLIPKGTGSIYGVRESWEYPLTDESTLPVVDTIYVTGPAPYDMAIEDVIAGLTVTGAGAALWTVDILKENSVNANAFTTILSTLITIDAAEYTSTTAATPPVISVATWEKGRRLQLKISLLDTDTLARGAKVNLLTHATAK